MEFQKLYKYRSISSKEDRERTRQIVVDGKIWYASPGQLNDPFDCRTAVSMEGAENLLPPGASERVIRECKDEAEEYFKRRDEEDLCVLSLSARNDDILMWSHYADYHRGICLELRVPLSNGLHPVKYSDERPRTYFADIMKEPHQRPPRFDAAAIPTVTTKAKQWTYEEEWRCIEFGGRGLRPLPHNMLTGIIFGWRMSQNDKHVVRSWLKGRPGSIALYEARERDGEFALDIVRLPDD